MVGSTGNTVGEKEGMDAYAQFSEGIGLIRHEPRMAPEKV
jgi:hypothetical protein